jgi:hypothetical protein
MGLFPVSQIATCTAKHYTSSATVFLFYLVFALKNELTTEKPMVKVFYVSLFDCVSV